MRACMRGPWQYLVSQILPWRADARSGSDARLRKPSGISTGGHLATRGRILALSRRFDACWAQRWHMSGRGAVQRGGCPPHTARPIFTAERALHRAQPINAAGYPATQLKIEAGSPDWLGQRSSFHVWRVALGSRTLELAGADGRRRSPTRKATARRHARPLAPGESAGASARKSTWLEAERPTCSRRRGIVMTARSSPSRLMQPAAACVRSRC